MLKTILLLSVLVWTQVVSAKERCEVCEAFLTKLEKELEPQRTIKNVEPALIRLCKDAVGVEKRFCFYIGATEDAATKMTNEVTRPLSYFKDVSKICLDLKKKDAQICELAYEKQIDWNNVNLKKMRVKELKKILNDWDESCDGCIEKSEFIKRIEELKPKYVREEL